MENTNEETISDTNREINSSGHLKVNNCVLTAESVDEYLGSELPKECLKKYNVKVDPDTIYPVYRPLETLKKCLNKYNGLPLTNEHHFVSLANTNKSKWLGGVGSNAKLDGNKLVNDLSIWDLNPLLDFFQLKNNSDDLNKLKDKLVKEGLSCGYMSEIVPEKGTWNGKPYDFKMVDIDCNHVAVVNKGRVMLAKLADSVNDYLTKGDKTMSKELLEALMKKHPDLVADVAAELKVTQKATKTIADSEKESTSSSASSTKTGDESPDDENDKDDKEDDKKSMDKKKVKDKKTKDMAKCNDEDESEEEKKKEEKAMTEDSINKLVEAKVREQIKSYNEAKQICEKAIGKTYFTADSQPEDMFDETLKSLGINTKDMTFDSKKVLLSYISTQKAAKRSESKASNKHMADSARYSNSSADIALIEI